MTPSLPGMEDYLLGTVSIGWPQNAVLAAMGHAVQSLLHQGDWQDSMVQVLGHYGRAVGVSRVYVFENLAITADDVIVSQRWEWVADGIAPQIESHGARRSALKANGYARWVETLSAGGVIRGHVRQFPVCEREELNRGGIRSLVVVPIMADQRWWGLLGLDECTREREWTTEEVDVLSIAASTLGAALTHADVQQTLRTTEEQFRRVLDISRDLIYWFDLKSNRYVYISSAIMPMYGLSPAEALALAPEHLISSHVHPDDQAYVAEALSSLDKAKPGVESYLPVIEYRFRHVDGSYRWVSECRSVFFDDQNRAAAVVGVVRDVTEHRRREDALRQSEERFRGVLDVSRDVVYRLNLLTRNYDYVSPASRQVLGYTPAEVQAMGYDAMLRYVHPDDLLTMLSEIRELCDSDQATDGDPRVSEYRFRHPEEGYRWIDCSRTVVRDVTGRVVAVVGALRDVTRRHQLEERRRRINDRLALLAQTGQDLADLAPDADVCQFFAGRIRALAGAQLVALSLFTCDGSVLQVRGLAGLERFPDEVFERFPRYLGIDDYPVSPQSREQIQPRRLALVEGGIVTVSQGKWPEDKLHEFEEEYQLGLVYALGMVRDGESFGNVVVIMPRGVPLESPELIEACTQQAAMYLQRQRAENALRESEERFRNLFESIGDGFLLFDRTLRVVDARDAKPPLLGLSREHALRQPAAAILSDIDAAPALVEGLQRVLDDGCPLALHSVLHGGRDAEWHVDLLAYRVLVKNQPHVALLCRDATEARRLETLRQRNQHLEALSRISSGVAHDFGNMLAVIRAQCELLIDRVAKGSYEAEGLRSVITVAESGADLTRQLITLERDEQTLLELLHLNLLVETGVPWMRHALGPKRQIVLHLNPEPLFVMGNEGQLNRVLLNLARNAAEAMPNGGTLTIESHHALLDAASANGLRVEPGPYALLLVSDTGRGIPECELPMVFDPFFTTKDGHMNSGLGLWVAYWVMQQHHGAISVESCVGQGTTFRLYLPLAPMSDETFEED